VEYDLNDFVPTIPVRTIGQLKAMIADLPDDLPLSSTGSDCGGYDAENGFNVFAGVTPVSFHIEHDDPDHHSRRKA